MEQTNKLRQSEKGKIYEIKKMKRKVTSKKNYRKFFFVETDGLAHKV